MCEFCTDVEEAPHTSDGSIDYSKVYGTVEYWQARQDKDGKIRLQTPGLTRAQVLDDAKEAVCSDRNAEYGEPEDNFGLWAGVCNALGYRGPGGRELKPHDMAVIAIGVKLARIMKTPGKQDHWVDTAGYAACGGECVTLED